MISLELGRQRTNDPTQVDNRSERTILTSQNLFFLNSFESADFAVEGSIRVADSIALDAGLLRENMARQSLVNEMEDSQGIDMAHVNPAGK
jgi:hypothetical protein